MEIPQTISAQTASPSAEKIENKKNTFIFKAVFTLCLLLLLPFIFLLSNDATKNQDIRSKATNILSSSAGKILFVPFSFSHDNDDDVLIEFTKKPEIRNGFIPVNQLSGKEMFSAVLLGGSGNRIVTVKFSSPDVVAIDGFEAVSGKEHAELKKVAANNYGFALPYYPTAAYLRIFSQQGNIVANITLKNVSSINNLVKPEEVNTDLLKDKIESRKKENQELLQKFRGNTKQNDNFRQLLNLDKFLPPAIAASGTFNIAIIGDNYGGNTALFQADVNDIVTGFLSVEPFSLNKANIVFYPQLSTATICTPVSGWPSISCNDTVALQQASSIPYDKVYVLYNGPYTGYAYVGGMLAYGTSSTDKGVKVKQGLFVHELGGHALGGLMDEYSYGTTGTSYAPNCSTSSPCSAWAGITGLGCFSTCGYTNLYRATDNNSVMNTAFLNGILSFDTYSTQIVQNQLSSYFAALPPTLPPTIIPTSTLPPSSPTIAPSSTPIPSPSPSPIITRTTLSTLTDSTVSTVTPQPTISNNPALTIAPSQILPSLTVVPTVTNVPTLTQQPQVFDTPTPVENKSFCTFPNYCTLAKYCTDDRKLSISCGQDSQVCCQPQEEPKKKEETAALNVFTPLPTVAVMPTSPPSGGNLFQPPQFPAQISPTSPAVVVSQPSSTPVPTLQTVPKIIIASPYPTQIQITTTLSPTEIVYPTPILVSATPFNPETFEFERATPTPQPSVSLFATFGSIFSDLLKSWFSGLFR